MRNILVLGAAMLGVALPCSAATSSGCKMIMTGELTVRISGLRALLPTKVNGQETVFILDSGAFFSTLDAPTAAKLKLKSKPLDPDFEISGVGGRERVALGTADTFEIGRQTFANVDFLIGGRRLDHDAAGLVGQNILNANDVEYDLANGVVRRFQTESCRDQMLAYWSRDAGAGEVRIESMSEDEPHITARASINGKTVVVMFDSGAPYSVLTLAAAQRVGFDKAGAGVTDGGLVGGIGRDRGDSWIAPFANFTLGDEAINNTKLRVADFSLDGTDMLLGADFFMSHRLYVSRSQHKLYFTYNGGPVFHLERATAATSADDEAIAGAEPKDTAGFNRRASALAARRNFTAAIADFDRAIALEPAQAGRYYERALARLGAKQTDLALVDLDQAIKLNPNDVQALTTRGALRLKGEERQSARADFAAAIKADEDGSIRLAVAEIYGDAGLTSEAIAEYDTWITAHPKDSDLKDALNSRCWTRAVAGKELDKALADCNAAMKAGGRESDVLDSRGMVYLRMGQFDRAISDYDAALKRQPKQAWSLYGRGLAKLRKGWTPEGRRDMKMALDLEPDLAAEALRFGLVEAPAPVNP